MDGVIPVRFHSQYENIIIKVLSVSILTGNAFSIRRCYLLMASQYLTILGMKSKN